MQGVRTQSCKHVPCSLRLDLAALPALPQDSAVQEAVAELKARKAKVEELQAALAAQAAEGDYDESALFDDED